MSPRLINPKFVSKIAIVCSTLNQLGGPASQIRNYYTQLNGGAFQFTLILCSADEDAVREFMLSGGVRGEDLVFIPHAKKRLLAPFVLELYDIFRRNKFDIVHAFETQTQVLAGVAARWAGVRNFVCHCVAQFLPATISLPKRLLFRVLNIFLRDYFRLSIAISSGLAKELTDNGFRPSSRVRVIPAGIRTKDVADRTFVYSGLEQGSPVIGSVSRLSVEKGLDRLVRAAALVVKEIPAARFVICGDGPEAPRLQDLVKNLGLAKNFEFQPWTRDVSAVLETFDIYAFPSLREGLGITLLEAMAVGRPSVASDIEGVRDIITNGVDGILVDTADPQAFCGALVAFCKEPLRAAQVGAKGFETVRSCFTLERETRRMGDLYKEILTGVKA